MRDFGLIGCLFFGINSASVFCFLAIAVFDKITAENIKCLADNIVGIAIKKGFNDINPAKQREVDIIWKLEI